MEKKNILVATIICLAVAGAAFYGGMQYGVGKSAKSQMIQGGRAGGNFSGQRPGGQRQDGNMQAALPSGGAGDFVGGEIIAKDETSITIKTRDGGSKIIFFSDKTTIDKSVSGSASDLVVGQQISANGKNNPDGSLAAQNVQIRPLQQNQ